MPERCASGARVLLPIGALLAGVIACSDAYPGAPATSAAGLYGLVEVDGQPLPHVHAVPDGMGGAVEREVHRGILLLGADGSFTLQREGPLVPDLLERTLYPAWISTISGTWLATDRGVALTSWGPWGAASGARRDDAIVFIDPQDGGEYRFRR